MSGFKRLRTAAVAGTAIASAAWLGGVASAFAQEPPPPGTTTTTRCEFLKDERPAYTWCGIQTLRITAAGCYNDGGEQEYLLWFEIHSAQALHYAGNVVMGDSVDGYYSEVRPHAKLISDSGVHAYSVGIMIPVDDC